MKRLYIILIVLLISCSENEQTKLIVEDIPDDPVLTILIKEYENAYADGVITQKELDDLTKIQEILGISDEDAVGLAVKGAIKSALADGKVTDEERAMIEEAASKLSKAKKSKLMKALDEGNITDDVEDILKSLED